MKNQGGFLSIILTIVVTMVLMSGAAFVWYKSDMGQKEQNNNIPVKVQQEVKKEVNKITEEKMEEKVIEIDDWLTYTDNDFGISFKYPNDPWRGFETSSDRITINQEHPGFGMHIRKMSSYPDSDAEDVLFDRNKTTINNMTYKKFWRQGVGNGGYGYVLVDENFGTYYMFVSIWGPDDELFEQIMETVSLVKVTPSGPTADWQTYVDEEYGFTLNIPMDLRQDKNRSRMFGSYEDNMFYVAIIDEQLDPDHILCNGSICEVNSLDIAGKDFYQSIISEEDRNLNSYKTSFGDKYIAFTFSNRVYNDPWEDSVVSQILKSFKFLETEVSQDDWQTYTNEEYSFSFEYPGNWVISSLDHNGIIVSNDSDTSRFIVLPIGELDYGLPFEEPKISEGLLDSYEYIKKEWPDLTHVYFREYPSDWNKNNRIDMLHGDSLDEVNKILNSFNFLD